MQLEETHTDKNYSQQMTYLISVIQMLSMARDMETIAEIVRHAARELTGADGATFVLKDGERCYYMDEDAISPLWKGGRFPLKSCISGFSMLHRKSLFIEDIYQDERIPIDLYRPTFVKSLAMVPIRQEDPIGAIGNYWATHHKMNPREIHLLEMLANSTSIAIENVQLYKDLQRQLEHRDEFLSIVGHELRTPITPLAIRVQLLKRILKEEDLVESQDKIRNHVNMTERQMANIIRLIDNFLDISRIQFGRFSMNVEEDVNLNEIISKLVEQYRPTFKGDIHFHGDSEVSGSWDPVRIEQLFHNLLSNAIRFGNERPIEIELNKIGHDRVRIFFKDQGTGVSKKDQERIFNRFERGGSSINYGGMGLGLYVSRQIVKGHGGEIWVEDNGKNKGSTFVVELPLTPPVLTH